MTAQQIGTIILGWVRYALMLTGLAILATLALRLFGFSMPLIRIGAVTEMATLAAACIYAGR
jgi:hypothetical protein